MILLQGPRGRAPNDRTMIRNTLAVLAFFCLTGMTSCGPFLQEKQLSSLEYRSKGEKRILDRNESVDQLATQIAAFMRSEGFDVFHQTTSFGIEPWTGYTRNVYFWLRDNDGVRAYVSVAKCCVSARFVEMETEIRSAVFAATPGERDQVQRIEREFGAFLHSIVGDEKIEKLRRD